MIGDGGGDGDGHESESESESPSPSPRLGLLFSSLVFSLYNASIYVSVWKACARKHQSRNLRDNNRVQYASKRA